MNGEKKRVRLDRAASALAAGQQPNIHISAVRLDRTSFPKDIEATKRRLIRTDEAPETRTGPAKPKQAAIYCSSNNG